MLDVNGASKIKSYSHAGDGRTSLSRCGDIRGVRQYGGNDGRPDVQAVIRVRRVFRPFQQLAFKLETDPGHRVGRQLDHELQVIGTLTVAPRDVILTDWNTILQVR